MAIERIDANIQGMISGANLDTQKKIDKEDEADHARKRLDKKLKIKKEQLKSSNVHREQFQRKNVVEQRMKQILGGAEGQDAADGLRTWQNNKEAQAKLTEAQKNLFREAMAKNPPKGAKTAKAFDNLTRQPGFQKAVNNSQQAGTLQKALIEDPNLEKPASQMLQSRFMQSKKADGQTKNRFMEFGFQQAKRGNLAAAKKAGDMLGTLAKNNVGKGAQRSAMNMAQRAPADGKAMSNVDAFVQNPDVGKMPTFARSKATELLAKASGKGEVKEGFEQLAGHQKFKAQTAQNKGRFFTTIGSGRPSEYRAITDKQLAALQNPGFPKRAGQVKKFLGKMSQQVQRGGAAAVDVKSALKASKSSPMPKLSLIPMTEDMSDEELAQARSQNRANSMQYFTKLQRMYEKSEKSLHSAKYLEDVNALQNLREPEDVDLSSLSPEEQAFIKERSASVKAKLEQVRKLQRQKARELRTRRMPPAKRRARAARRRVQGRQPKYFTPGATRRGNASQAFLQATGTHGRQGLPTTPQRGAMANRSAQAMPSPGAGNLDIQGQVSSALSQLGGQLTPETAGQVAATIANQVAQQVAQQVTDQLLGAMGGQTGRAGTTRGPQTSAPRGRAGSGLSSAGKSSGPAPMPTARRSPPSLSLMPLSEDMAPEQFEAGIQANQGAIDGYFGEIEQMIGQAEQQISNASTPAEFSAIQLPPEPELPASTSLTPQEVAFVKERAKSARAAYQRVQTLMSQKSEQLGRTQTAMQSPPSAGPARSQTQQGRVDGWGIPRTFERDLGGTPRAAVRPAGAEADEAPDGPTFEQVVNESYTGKMLIKDPSSIREIASLFQTNWKELNKAEMALLKNLGWNQQTWDTKDTPAGKWPRAMMTPFVNLNPVQREAVRKLGFTPHDWDTKVQAFSMGKNA